MSGERCDAGNPARPYWLDHSADWERLFRELVGYMRVSLHDGTDTAGRQHALDALAEIRRIDHHFAGSLTTAFAREHREACETLARKAKEAGAGGWPA